MDPGFHRGDDKAEMTETRVDFQSTNSEPLGLEPRVIQCDRSFAGAQDDCFFEAVILEFLSPEESAWGRD